MRAALAQMGPHFRVEIIQPLEGNNPYTPRWSATAGRDHIHHVRFDVSDYEIGRRAGRPRPSQRHGGALRRRDRGEPAALGRYVDTTEDLGFLLELAHVPSGFVMATPEYEYPPS